MSAREKNESQEIPPGLRYRNPLRESPADRKNRESKTSDAKTPQKDNGTARKTPAPSTVVRLTDEEMEIVKIIIRIDRANRVNSASRDWRDKAEPLARRIIAAKEIWITREPTPPF